MCSRLVGYWSRQLNASNVPNMCVRNGQCNYSERRVMLLKTIHVAVLMIVFSFDANEKLVLSLILCLK